MLSSVLLLAIIIAIVHIPVTIPFQSIVRRGNNRFIVSSKRLLTLSMKEYSVRIINKKQSGDNTIKVPSNKYILDQAEESAVQIPYSCRAGSCSSCLGQLKSGSVDQSSQIFLSDSDIDKGYILTCVAYPLSDIEIEVNIEQEFYLDREE